MNSLHGKRLVIFGCGYVGAAVARDAVGGGLQVQALTRSPARTAELAAAGVDVLVADLATSDWHGRVAPGAVRNLIFNVSDDAPGTKSEVVRWLAAQTCRPAPRFSGEASDGRLGFSHLPDRRINNGRIKATLGWRPKHASFREGYEAILGGARVLIGRSSLNQ
jgi:nucleoside-diphosphate-sugar epimerase